MSGCLSPDRIFLYLEGELGPAASRAFEGHLGRCPECRAAFNERRLLHEAFTSLAPLEVPDGFARRVMEAIPDGSGAAFRPFAALAAAALALAATLLGFRLAMGESLTSVLVSAGRAAWAGLGGSLPLLAKTVKAAGLILDLLSGLAASFAGSLGILSSFVRPELALPAVGLGFALTIAMILGARRLLSIGEKP